MSRSSHLHVPDEKRKQCENLTFFFFFFKAYTVVKSTRKHLANIIEPISYDVRGAQVSSQTVFNGHVGINQGDHGQVAVTTLAVLRLVDCLKLF